MKHIIFICHANICRSPMAEFIMKDMLAQSKCSEEYTVSSAAVSHIKEGEGIHPASLEQLIIHGISKNPLLSEKENENLLAEIRVKKACKFRKEDYKNNDLIIVMDHKNREHLRFLLGDDIEGKIHYLSKYAGITGDIDDPWNTGDFQKAFEQIQAGCRGLLEELTK